MQGPELVVALKKLKDKTSWEIAALIQEGRGSYDRKFSKQFEKEKDPRVAVLGKMFGICWPLDYRGDWDGDALKAWKLAGIDLVARFEASEKQSQPALPLAKKDPVQGRRLEVKGKRKPMSAANRARILAAQKARWAKVTMKVKGGKK